MPTLRAHGSSHSPYPKSLATDPKGGRAVIIALSLIVVSLLTVSLLVIITLICKRRRARPLPVEVVGVQISALQISAPSAGTYDMRPNAAVQLGKGVV